MFTGSESDDHLRFAEELSLNNLSYLLAKTIRENLSSTKEF